MFLVSYKSYFFSRFTAEDPDSGRREYFVSRGSQLDVTELTKKGIRVQDPRVLNIRGTVLRGVSVGRSEVQVGNNLMGTFCTICTEDTYKIFYKNCTAYIITYDTHCTV